MSDQPAIVVEGLVKHFGDVHALDGIDLTVRPGTVYGLLGPNGAGKTTAVRVLTTIITPDAGRAEVLGLDVVRQARQVRANIGLAGQYAAVDEQLTGRENLRLVGRLTRQSPKVVRNTRSPWRHAGTPRVARSPGARKCSLMTRRREPRSPDVIRPATRSVAWPP